MTLENAEQLWSRLDTAVTASNRLALLREWGEQQREAGRQEMRGRGITGRVTMRPPLVIEGEPPAP